MSTHAAPGFTIDQLETSILSDVVTRFANLWESTSRYSLLVKYEGRPAWQAINNLVARNALRKVDFNRPSDQEEYVPTAAAFELCGNAEFLERARMATTVVLHTVKQMFKGERKKEGYSFDDLLHSVNSIYPDAAFDPKNLRLGLYLARDFSVLSSYGSDWRNPAPFQISEAAIAIANPDSEWDRVMANLSRAPQRPEASPAKEMTGEWENIKRLGGGGQSDVFLVRSPQRAEERAACLQKIRVALDGDRRADLADAIWAYSRPEANTELGAKKVFKIRDKGGEQQALERLKQEFHILKQGRSGLPKLLDSNESERWIVTEFFPNGTVEDNILRYEGKPALALKAFLTLVNTVARLHDEGIVHRDIKPANVFVGINNELVLGDFGIVYLPDQPVRLTRTNESVGPHDYMPPWADTGERLEKVDTRFDVYMLGKLLWCMVAGRLVLKREWFRRLDNDVAATFKDDPHAYMINTILEKCVVERSEDCIGTHDLREMVKVYVNVIDQGGQLLEKEVPRPCHVCGHGTYELETFRQSNPAFYLRLWNMSGGAQDINTATVRLYACNRCGHIAMFRGAS